MAPAQCGCRIAEDLARDELAKPEAQRMKPGAIEDTARKLGKPWGCTQLGFKPPATVAGLPKAQQAALRACSSLVGFQLPPTCPRSHLYDPRMREALNARDLLRDGLHAEVRQRAAWVREAAEQIKRADDDVAAHERRVFEEQRSQLPKTHGR